MKSVFVIITKLMAPRKLLVKSFFFIILAALAIKIHGSEGALKLHDNNRLLPQSLQQGTNDCIT